MMQDHQVSLCRLPDWRGRLAAYMAEILRRRFRPGQHDCALFVAGAIQAQTGTDFAAEWRGKYIALGAGQAMLRAQGFDDHLDLARSLLPEIPPAMAQIGDVAVLPSGIEGEAGALGVVQGAGVYGLSPSGLSVVSRLHMIGAFKV